MKILYKIIIIFFSLTLVSLNASDKKVLVEIFTNAGCPLCPPAHTTINNYLQNSSNADKIAYIYYDIPIPYHDELYLYNSSDSDAKYKYYLNSSGGNPAAFFDGKRYSNSFNSWGSTLDNLETQPSSFDIILSGNYTNSDFTVNAEITKISETTNDDLVVDFIVVEDVEYNGGNGIRNHKHVMRKIANVNGDPLTIGMNETKEMSSTFNIDNIWNQSNLGVVVFIQSKSTKTVYQSEYISYSTLNVTSINENKNLPGKFQLYQNYPNPFNPTTTIKYSIPENQNRETSNVKIVVYDVLGNEIKTLVNKIQQTGNYEVSFNASDFPSGIYFYKLNFGNFSATRKMILVK